MVKPYGNQPAFLTLDLNISEAIANLNHRVKQLQRGKGLNDLQIQILEQVWLGAAYKEMAETLNYDADYIKRIAAQLWRLLSKISDHKISKSNICSLLEHYASNPPTPDTLQLQDHSGLSGDVGALDNHEMRWVGREETIARLCMKLQSNCYFLTIAGITGVGKSSLAMRLILDPSQAKRWDRVEIICCDRNAPNFDQFARQILGESFHPEATEEETQTQLFQVLTTHPQLIVLDMVEELIIADGPRTHRYQDVRFPQLFEQIIASDRCSSRFILTSQIHPPRLALGRFPYREHLERLAGLSEEEVLQLFQVWDIPAQTTEERQILLRFARTYEGHALALRVIAGDIRAYPYQGNIQAYWNEYGDEIQQIEQFKSQQSSKANHLSLSYYAPNLAELVEKRVQRCIENLRVQNYLAYRLLCMGSVFRGSIARTAWLIQIGEASKQDQLAAFQALQRRFLLEEDLLNGQIRYRLHSLIRSVALEHLEKMVTQVSS